MEALEARLGYTFRDRSLLENALMHSSYANENRARGYTSNERLEFLGDAILDAIVGDIVYHHFPGKREGFLTNTRSKLVQRDTLNKLSQEMGIDQLILSNGHSASHNSYLGGNAFEALVGAIYLDKGYKGCMDFMQQRILGKMINIDKLAYKEVNFKSKLLEWAQRNRLGIEFISNDPGKGAATSETPTFLATVMIENVECGKGNGFSKKESHQNAARETLIMLNANKQKIAEILKSKEQRTAMEAELISVPPRVSDGKRHSHPKRRNSAPQRAQNGVRENVVADTKTPQVNALLQSAKACTDNIGLTTNNEPPVSSGGENEKGNRKCNYNKRRRKQARDAADNAQTRQKSRDAIIVEAENKAFNK